MRQRLLALIFLVVLASMSVLGVPAPGPQPAAAADGDAGDANITIASLERPAEIDPVWAEAAAESSKYLLTNPDEYAGSWYDIASGTAILAHTAEASSSFKAELHAAAERSGHPVKLVEVPRSHARLEEELRTIIELHAADIDMPYIGVDHASNGLVIGLSSGAQADRALRSLSDRGADTPIRVEMLDAGFGAGTQGRQDDTTPYSGGAGFRTSSDTNFVPNCTMGLPMKAGSTHFMVTAGHCTQDEFDYEQASHFAHVRSGGWNHDQLMGVLNPNQYPNTLCWVNPGNNDFPFPSNNNCLVSGGKFTGGKYSYESDGWSMGDVTGYSVWGTVKPRIYSGKSLLGSGPHLHDNSTASKVIGSAMGVPALGTPLCYSGARTGSNCTHLVANTYIYYKESFGSWVMEGYVGPTVMTWADSGYQSLPGDSGSPVYANGNKVKAAGILSGSWCADVHNCGIKRSSSQGYNGGMFFTSVIYPSYMYGAQVVTQ